MEAEAQLFDLLQSGDKDQVATTVVERYGPEVCRYLASMARDHDLAAEAFSMASEDLWTSLDSFQGRCSLRTWFFRLGTHSLSRLRRRPDQQARRRKPLSQIGEVAARIRTETAPHLRTENKLRLRQLREQLTEEEQQLILLRIDRNLDWKDIARILDAGDLDEAELKKSAAKLRQRFQTTKTRLRKLAETGGLVRE